MKLVVVGLNHRAAPVEARERLAFAPGQQAAALAALLGRAAEAAILSTCNRTEVYAVVADDGAAESVAAFLGDFHGLPPEAFARYLYRYEGIRAAEHLFAVASGLDSPIVGEPQILGQVRAAYETAADHRAVGPMLSRVFHHALRVGKRVRSRTGIGRHAVSLSYAVVELARQAIGGLAGLTVLIVGAGKVGELTARALSGEGPARVLVANRTYARAAELASRVGGRAVELESLPALLSEADVVVCSTGAPGFVLTANLVEPAIHGRDGRPLLLVDLAVPRDVDPAVRELDGVHLHDVDDLQGVCLANLRAREEEVAAARSIVDAEVAELRGWWESLRVVPLISALRRQAEEIRQAELRKTLGRFGDLSDEQRLALDALTSAIVNKLLHRPIARLKAPGEGGDYARALRDLFDLDEAS